MDKEIYSTEEIAKMFGCHIETVRRWIQRGELKAVQVFDGAPYRILRRDFEKFLEEKKKIV